MDPIEATTMRTNIGSWCVPAHDLPALGRILTDILPPEAYDPLFYGQELETTYFDTPDFDLRKARKQGDQYLTLRLRCYEPSDGSPDVYALSAKTEFEKWRLEIAPTDAE